MIEPGSKFPYTFGYDLSGVVAAVGKSVTAFKVGDEVYSRISDEYRGSIAEYALTLSQHTALKPKTLGFSEAAAIPLTALTALQALYRADQGLEGGLKGKTVYVPAGLSGTGSFAVQLAKNVFGAGKVITTVSTAKVPKIKELLGAGTPDQIIDYKKEKVAREISKGTVDFVFDTMGETLSVLPLVKKTGMIVSVSTLPSGTEMKKSFPGASAWVVAILNLVNFFFVRWASLKGPGVRYSYIFMHPSGEDLERVAEWVDEGKVKPVVGRKAKLEDVDAVRAGCQEVLDAKGGVGKFVIDID